MAVTTTPLGFKKPDGNDPVRNGDNVIADNAQTAEQLHANERARIVQLEAAAGFAGTGIDLSDAAVNPLLDTPTTTRGKLDARYARSESPAFTGTPTGLTKAHVGLGNVDNTSDANKPVSAAQKTALDGKLDATQRGAANGVASLGADGKLPTGQLPADPLKPWKDAVQNQTAAPAIYVNLGDSIANGGNPTTASRAWVNRVTALFTSTAAARLDATTLTPAPANGVMVYNGAVGGTTSANYLTDALVTRIGTLKPQLITHMVKANDQGQGITPATYRANLLSWINKIKAVSPNTVHVLINEHNRYDLASPAYSSDSYRDQLVSLAAETGAVFFDIAQEFKKHGIPGSDRYALMDTDNLHFADRGNQVYAKIIGTFIGAPPVDYIPRELVRPSGAFSYGTFSAVTTVGTITIKPKPYLREGTLAADYYGTAGNSTQDLILRLTPSGGTRIDVMTHRMPSGVLQNHPTSGYVTLEPNTAYTATLDLGIYSGSFTANGSAGYSQFYADLSPA